MGRTQVKTKKGMVFMLLPSVTNVNCNVYIPQINIVAIKQATSKFIKKYDQYKKENKEVTDKIRIG
jgi:hypothetical protein